MKTIQLQWSPEIPEFSKLGRDALSSLSSEDFWVLLIQEATPIDDPDEPLVWEPEAFAEEYLGGDDVPETFSLESLRSLKHWSAFAWERGCVEIGVLQHSPAGLCRAFCYAGDADGGPCVGPPITFSSRQEWALACLALLRAVCSELAAPHTSDFTNYVPEFVTKQQILDAFKLDPGCSSDELEAFVSTRYSQKQG